MRPEIEIKVRKKSNEIVRGTPDQQGNRGYSVNPCPAEPGYTLPLQTV